MWSFWCCFLCIQELDFSWGVHHAQSAEESQRHQGCPWAAGPIWSHVIRIPIVKMVWTFWKLNHRDLRTFWCAKNCTENAATVCDSAFAVSFRCIAAWAFWIAPALIPAQMRFWWTLQLGFANFQLLGCSSFKWTTLTLDNWYDNCGSLMIIVPGVGDLHSPQGIQAGRLQW